MKPQTPLETIQEFIGTLPDFKNHTVQPTDSGVSTDVYKLIKNRETLYLRLSDPNQNISTEVMAHKLILEKGVKIPKVVAYEDYNETLDRSYMITTKIPGVSIKENKTNRKKVVFEAGKQIALVNSILVNGFGWLDWTTPNTTTLKGTYYSYKDFALNFSRIENMLGDLRDRNVMDKTMTDAYMKYVIENQNIVECSQAHLAHGDFDLSHIFVQDGAFSGFIDFGDIRATSVYHDLAHFFTYSSESFDDLLQGYLEVTPLEGGYKERIEFVAMLFVIGKLWCVTKNHRETLAKRRNDFELLKRNLHI